MKKLLRLVELKHNFSLIKTDTNKPPLWARVLVWIGQNVAVSLYFIKI